MAKEFDELSSEAQNAIVDTILGNPPESVSRSVKSEIADWAALRRDELWTCFTCNYVGLPAPRRDDDENVCPRCGTHDGDGFGMLINDPRYRV